MTTNRGAMRTRQQELHNKTCLVFYFEKKAGVTAEPPAPQYHVARFLSCPPFQNKKLPKPPFPASG
jgi:hypothetical protein